MNTKRLVALSILLSMSIVLAIVESFIPALPIPGSKLGLANIMTLVTLYLFNEKDALVLVILRILLVGLLRGTLGSPTFFLSLSGGTVAYIMMVVFKQLKVFSAISVSVMGSLGHSLGQIVIAIVILSTPELIYYFPFIFLIAIPTGVFTGAVALKFIDIFEGEFQFNQKVKY